MIPSRLLSVAVVLLCFASHTLSTGHAEVVTSTNRTDFILTPQPFPGAWFSGANFLAHSGDISLHVVTTAGNPLTISHRYFDITPVLPGGEYVLDGDENFDVLFSSRQRSFAFDYTDDSVASTFVLDFLDGGTNVGSTSFTTSSFGVANFIGFTSTVPFNRIDVREFDGANNTNEFFQFYTATRATPAVPEIDPAGVGSVMALASGALALLERRRRRSV